MFPANMYRIWFAGADDADALRWLEARAGQPPLIGRVLIGEIHGAPAAAVSLYDGRAVADPAQSTDRLIATLRMRVGAVLAYEATPSLRERLRAALPAYGETVAMPARHDDKDERLAA